MSKSSTATLSVTSETVLKETLQNGASLQPKQQSDLGHSLQTTLRAEKAKHIGKAVSLYLLTWNFQRFKEYFKYNEQFDLDLYFKELGIFLELKRAAFKNFLEKNLVSDPIEETEIRRLFGEINVKLKELGKWQNEPVGTAKILHIFAPHYFPLIDNSEAQAIGITDFQESLTVDHYLTWMNALKRWSSELH